MCRCRLLHLNLFWPRTSEPSGNIEKGPYWSLTQNEPSREVSRLCCLPFFSLEQTKCSACFDADREILEHPALWKDGNTHTLIKEQGPQLENLLKYSLKDTHSVYFNSNTFPPAPVSSLAFTCDSCYPGLSYTDVPGWVCPPWHFSFGTLAFDILEDWKQNYNNLASMQQWKQRRTRDHGCCRQPNWVLVFPAVIQPPAHWQLGFSLGSGGDLVASSAMAVSRYSCSFFPCHLYSHICRYKQNKA